MSNVDDAKEYLETRNAMEIVGIDQDEQVLGQCMSAWHFNEAVICVYQKMTKENSLYRMLSFVWYLQSFILGTLNLLKGLNLILPK